MVDEAPFSIDLSTLFTTTQIFPTRDNLVSWVKEVGKANGVVVIILRSDVVGKKGHKNIIIFGCDKSGKYKGVNISCSVKKFSKKISCSFKLRATPLSDNRDWRVNVRCGLHNHRLYETCTGLAFFGQLSKKERFVADEHTYLNVKPMRSLEALKRRFMGNLTTITQIYSQRRMFRTNSRGPRTELQELMRLVEEGHYLCWSRRVQNTDVVTEIMWAHSNSINLLRMFPNILIMDSTYKTNKYRLPLLEIVGITSTELTFSVAFAYLSNERYENFRWALQTLKNIMVVDISLPNLFITDRDIALMSAIEVVFPSALNLLCWYHINKDVSAKCKQNVMKDRQKSIMDLWMSIVDSTDQVHFFEQSFIDIPYFVKYVNDTWLIPHKEKFILAWTNEVTHFENTTTNR